MQAEIVQAEAPGALDRAAALLSDGQLVAFATETVYGLGGDARSTEAIERIYAAKGRPAHNPMIVHVLDAEAAREVTTGWDARADALAEAFWPGPLTLVLQRAPDVPPAVAGGGETLAVRAPGHRTARALLRRFAGPIVAPSANRSTAISPTRAEHVADELGDRIGLILDGGPCGVGVESTVLDLTGEEARLLRPGAITGSQIEAVIGAPLAEGEASPGPLRSPGLLRRHYAPQRTVELYGPTTLPADRDRSAFLYRTVEPTGAKAARRMPSDAEEFARGLYEALRWADAQPVDRIAVERPPTGEAWAAIHDRLSRAAEKA